MTLRNIMRVLVVIAVITFLGLRYGGGSPQAINIAWYASIAMIVASLIVRFVAPGSSTPPSPPMPRD